MVTLADAETLGDRIARYRGKLSQEDVARRAGIAASTYNRIERGKNKNPSQRTLTAIAGALRVNVRDLLEREINPGPSLRTTATKTKSGSPDYHALHEAFLSLREEVLDLAAIVRDVRSIALDARATARLCVQVTQQTDETPPSSTRPAKKKA